MGAKSEPWTRSLTKKWRRGSWAPRGAGGRIQAAYRHAAVRPECPRAGALASDSTAAIERMLGSAPRAPHLRIH